MLTGEDRPLGVTGGYPFGGLRVGLCFDRAAHHRNVGQGSADVDSDALHWERTAGAQRAGHGIR